MLVIESYIHAYSNMGIDKKFISEYKEIIAKCDRSIVKLLFKDKIEEINESLDASIFKKKNYKIKMLQFRNDVYLFDLDILIFKFSINGMIITYIYKYDAGCQTNHIFFDDDEVNGDDEVDLDEILDKHDFEKIKGKYKIQVNREKFNEFLHDIIDKISDGLI